MPRRSGRRRSPATAAAEYARAYSPGGEVSRLTRPTATPVAVAPRPAMATIDTRAARWEAAGLKFPVRRSQRVEPVDPAHLVRAAESAAGPSGGSWASGSETADHVADVLRDAGWPPMEPPEIRYDADPPDLTPDGADAWYSADSDDIHLQPGERRPEVILHEVAHWLLRGAGGHGPQWTGIYLGLLGAFDAELAVRYAEEFLRHGVAVDSTYAAVVN